jgi:hypothetical protein
LAFLQLKADGFKDKEVRMKLDQLFPVKIVSEVLEDFKERTTQLFSKMPLPSCPDCKLCKIAKYCLWEEWEKKNTIITQKLNAFHNFSVVF